MKIGWRLLSILLTCVPLVAHGTDAGCKPETARYELKGDASWQAGFRPLPRIKGWISNLAFYVESTKDRRTFWFLFDQGSARYTSLISTTDVREKDWVPPDPDGGIRPLGDSHFFALNQDLMVIETVPEQSGEAPPYIFLPDLPELLWYQAKPRLSAPGGVFILKHCQ